MASKATENNQDENSLDEIQPVVLTAPENDARRFVISILIVIGIALSGTASQQFAKATYSPAFNAAYFVTWFSTMWLVLCLPTVTGIFMIQKHRRTRTGSRQVLSNPLSIFGSTRNIVLKRMTGLGMLFTSLFLASNYLYVRALAVTSPADAAAIFASNKVMIYVLSCLLLKANIVSFRIFALVGAVAGVIIISYADGFQGAHFAGVLMVLGSALCASLYVVLFKRIVNPTTYAEVGLFLGIIGVINLTIFWIFLPITYHFLNEVFHWSSIPWLFVCGSAALSLVFNFLLNFGVALTNPFFVALGSLLTIPLNAVIDAVWLQSAFGVPKIIGTALLVASFLLVLLLSDRHDQVLRKMFLHGTGLNDAQSTRRRTPPPPRREQHELVVDDSVVCAEIRRHDDDNADVSHPRRYNNNKNDSSRPNLDNETELKSYQS